MSEKAFPPDGQSPKLDGKLGLTLEGPSNYGKNRPRTRARLETSRPSTRSMIMALGATRALGRPEAG